MDNLLARLTDHIIQMKGDIKELQDKNTELEKEIDMEKKYSRLWHEMITKDRSTINDNFSAALAQLTKLDSVIKQKKNNWWPFWK